jgi:hypothetical protein
VKVKAIKPDLTKLVIIGAISIDKFITPDDVKLYLYTMYENAMQKKSEQLIKANSLKVIEEESETKMEQESKWIHAVKSNVNLCEKIEEIEECKTVLCHPGEFYEVIEADA